MIIFALVLKRYRMKEYEIAREMMHQMLRTRMAFRQALQRILKRNNVDMTFEMLQVMSILWQQQGLSQQTLAERTAKDKACMTNLMNNLEKKGWVTRREDPADRRNRMVYLTSEGERMNDSVRPLIIDLYSKTVEGMGEDEIRSCINQLGKWDEILNQL